MLRNALIAAAIAFGFIAIAGPAGAATPARKPASTLTKAERFYDQQEWASASAMYSLLIDEHPDSANYYARAIIADGMRGDTAAQTRLMHQALAHRIVVDALFNRIESECLQIGNAYIYEQFLTALKNDEPWMARAIDARLMRFYAFRRYPRESVRYADIILSGLPDNIPALYILAQGYLGQADYDRATDVYRRILSIDPNAVEALLYLGNSAADEGNTTVALDYLRRAEELKPTPYLSAQIKRLEESNQ